MDVDVRDIVIAVGAEAADACGWIEAAFIERESGSPCVRK
jgi:hypothetical protein